jgi:hypothetical protein
MRLMAAALASALALAVSGCGSDQDQISDKVHQLAKAVGAHDYRTICDQVLAPSLLNRLVGNGIPCAQALQLALQGVQQPVISIGKITVHGSTAAAITLTVARGQQASLATIDLVKTSGGWRIASLGSPLVGARR